MTKHMDKIIAAEEDRIRAEIFAKIFECFTKAGYKITISHDQDNKTERPYKNIPPAGAYAFESEYACGRFWMFAYNNLDKNPKHWVLFVTDNVQDIISDYSVSCEAIIKPANDLANKYD